MIIGCLCSSIIGPRPLSSALDPQPSALVLSALGPKILQEQEQIHEKKHNRPFGPKNIARTNS